jgi:hypothetical protein
MRAVCFAACIFVLLMAHELLLLLLLLLAHGSCLLPDQLLLPSNRGWQKETSTASFQSIRLKVNKVCHLHRINTVVPAFGHTDQPQLLFGPCDLRSSG